MGEFSPPFSEPPSFFSYPSTRLWFYYIITKLHLPFQNPGSAPGLVLIDRKVSKIQPFENVKIYKEMYGHPDAVSDSVRMPYISL